MSQSKRLAGKATVLIGAGQTTGETIGNGRATALALAREGARLLLVDIDQTSVKETQAILREEGFEAEVALADVTREADCRAVIEQATGHYGRLDILHYSAGIGYKKASVSEEDAHDWDTIMAVNLRGFFFAIKHAIPVMQAQKSGVITAISSIAAITPGSSLAYMASKAGINALIQNLAVRHGPDGIRFNTVMPGLMDTPMVIEQQAKLKGVDRDTIRNQRNQYVPLNHQMGTAWDIANAIVFLASEDAKHITGVSLPVDGGVTSKVGG